MLTISFLRSTDRIVRLTAISNYRITVECVTKFMRISGTICSTKVIKYYKVRRTPSTSM